jgi:hypothetical protein
MKNLALADACYEVFSSYENTGSVEHFKKKTKAEKTAKKAAKKAVRKDKLEGFKDKLAQGVEKIGKIAVLAPFRGLMINQLNEKGIKTETGGKFSKETDLSEIASAFYNNVIRKGQTQNFVLSAAALSGIISGVLSFFKMLKKKKEEGGTLTPSEEKMVTAAEQVSEKAAEIEKDYTEEGIGELIMKYWWVLAAVGLLFILKK